jgi:hypothetical protein
VVAIEAWPELPARVEADAALEARAASLHEEREVGGWFPGEKSMQVLSNRLDEVDASPLQLTEGQKQEQRLQKIMMTAAEVTADERRVWAYRLWRTAELLEKTGRDEKGRIARAEARLLFHDAKAPSRFLERLFGKVVELADRARAEQLAAQGQAPAPPPEKKSPGGLIVP